MSVEDRLSKLEARHNVMSFIALLAIVGLGGVAGYEGWKLHSLETATSLRVRELRVYDDKGIDRVVIGGNLPQAILDGKPMKSPHRSMAGILIYDGTGTERGGYGTFDGYANAVMTLDAHGHQAMLLMAEPDGGAFFRQWEGTSSVTMGAYDKPFLTVMDGKDVVFAKPEDNEWTKRGLK